MERWLEEERIEWPPGGAFPRRRVMVGLLLPVVGGAVVGAGVEIPSGWFLLAGAIFLLPLFIWVRREGSVWGLLLTAGLLMAAHARLHTSGEGRHRLGALMARPSEYFPFIAVVLEDAVPRPARPGQPADLVFPARVEQVNRLGVWQPVTDRIRVVIRGRALQDGWPRYGERWRFHGVVRVNVPRTGGLLRGRENQALIAPDRARLLAVGAGNRWMDWIWRQRRHCREILRRGLTNYPEESAILQALILGYREDLPKPLRQDFAATGTVHIFAISGAHVGMVALLVIGLLRSLRIPFHRWFWAVVPILGIYTLMTGAAASAIRAWVMASLFLLAPALKRRPDALSALATAAILILLAAPDQIGDLGFVLSFTAVAGLLSLPPLLEAEVFRRFQRDPWQLPEEEPPGTRRIRESLLAIGRLGGFSLSAWLATAPLTALFFHLVAPIALAMNLVVIPCAFLILWAGVMSVVTAGGGAFFPEVFNHAARVFASLLTVGIQWAAGVRGGHWFVPAPPVWGVWAWYGVLFLIAMGARRIRWVLPAGLAVLAVLALAWFGWENSRCRLTFLDVGESNATLIQARRSHMLIDAGPSYAAESILRQLRAEGVNDIEVLVLTHADARHVGAAREILQEIPVREIWVPERTWPSAMMKQILETAGAEGIPRRELRRGDSGDWPADFFWEVLWPPEGLKLAEADDGALVFRVARRGVSVILAGDLGGSPERSLSRGGEEMAGRILGVGRHGDGSATSRSWLEAVRPYDAVISCGPGWRSRNPDEEVLARLAAHDVRIWRTDQQGRIRVDLARYPVRWPHPGYRISAEKIQ